MKNCLKATIVPAILLLLLLVFGLGCGDDDKPDKPTIKLGSMTATIDGTHWESWPNFATATRNAGDTEVEGSGTGPLGADTCDVTIFIANPAIGTIELGGEANDTNRCWVYIANDANYADYSTYHASATGTAVITSITANRIGGTFSFSAYSYEGDSVVVTDGTFDLPIFDLPW